MTRYAVIMAGGSGERFWPVSRKSRPKQFLPLGARGKTMLEEAVERIVPLVGAERTVVATVPHLTMKADEILDGAVEVFAEPLKRNTAGALVWAAAHIEARVGSREATMAVLTSDHRIGPAERFRSCVDAAFALAERDATLVTIGIEPTRPETGFGYIEIDGDTIESVGEESVYRVRAFREKPSLERAKEFLGHGDFYWNSGMFFWTLATFADELGRVAPKHRDVLDRLVPLVRAGNREDAERTFAELPDISIDYALMEKARRVSMVRASFEWDDLGSWDALDRHLEGDDHDNRAIGEAILHSTEGTTVFNDAPDMTVCVAGVKDLVVVATADAVLVCDKHRAQQVRDIVQKLKTRNREDLLE
ncbi:MAG: mannose-1-phosphate guanylyltransferase [Fimbriimonadaceae bacterium]|nr:mannose-1-phosphate guanylyltransferase [Fimbriimonadaceae bacterium]